MMDAFSPEIINMYQMEMQHKAEHYRLIKITRADCVSWLRRVTSKVQHWFAAQRRQTRQANAWETAEVIAASKPHLTTGNC